MHIPSIVTPESMRNVINVIDLKIPNLLNPDTKQMVKDMLMTKALERDKHEGNPTVLTLYSRRKPSKGTWELHFEYNSQGDINVKAYVTTNLAPRRCRYKSVVVLKVTVDEKETLLAYQQIAQLYREDKITIGEYRSLIKRFSGIPKSLYPLITSSEYHETSKLLFIHLGKKVSLYFHAKGFTLITVILYLEKKIEFKLPLKHLPDIEMIIGNHLHCK